MIETKIDTVPEREMISDGRKESQRERRRQWSLLKAQKEMTARKNTK